MSAWPEATTRSASSGVEMPPTANTGRSGTSAFSAAVCSTSQPSGTSDGANAMWMLW